MTISDEQRDTLLKYRVGQAYEAIDEARVAIENDKLKMAVNRIYYGMFYVLSALALKYQFKTSKHQQLMGWFNKNFVKDEKIDRKYGRMVRRAFKARSDSDYGAFVKFEKPDVEKMFEDMKDFIPAIENYMNIPKEKDK